MERAPNRMNVPFIDLKRAHDPIRAELLEAFARTLDHGEFCLGSEVSDFESGFASVQGISRVVGVGSGTEALHLIACALVGSGRRGYRSSFYVYSQLYGWPNTLVPS